MARSRQRTSRREECPHCGALFAAGRLACPECGSDAATGWRDAADIDYLAVDLPDDPDEPWAPRPSPLRPIVLVLLILALVIWLVL